MPVPSEKTPPEPLWLHRHADVAAAALDPDTFSSAVSAHLNVPNGMDGAEHARYRAVVDKYMTPERTAAIEPICQAVAADLVAEMPSGVPVDVVAGLGRRYAVRGQSQWLGWPAELEEPLLQWMADNHAATRSGDLAETTRIARRFDTIITGLINTRRMGRIGGRSTPVDPTDELAHDFVGNAPLLQAEIVSILRNWTAGDLGTISRCVGSIVNHLAQHPGLQQELRGRLADPDDEDLAFADAAIDEMLRIENPFLSNRRKTTRATQVGEHCIESGRRVHLDWVAANRDPAVFGDPDEYRPRENAANNLVYGVGSHVCPGRGLSTMELRVATAELLEQTTAIIPAPGLPNVRVTPPLGGFGSVHVILVKKQDPPES